MSDQSGRILVVDDNEMNRDMLSRRLKRQQYNVAVAEDGLQALQHVQSEQVDLILLDIMMPNMSGYEVLETLKQNPDTQHIPVIMISAVDELDSVVKCIELGAEDYLFKPFNPVLLRARVSASLSKRHKLDTAAIQSALTDVQTQLADLRAQLTELTPQQTQHFDALTQRLSDLQAIIAGK